MGKFDDLFDSFFNRDDEEENKNNSIDDDAKKIISMINSFKQIDPDSEAGDAIDDELNFKLGEPDEIKYYEDDGMYYEKRIWFMEHGMIVKTIASDEPLEPLPSLEEQLEIAIEAEDYETAAKLRDQIKKDKAKAKRLANKLLKAETKDK